MKHDALAQGIIDALPEPAFLLTGEGCVVGISRAARLMLGENAGPRQASDMVSDPKEEVAAYLARCRQTSTPLPGALTFRAATGERRFRVHCGRLHGQPGEAVLLLRCADPRGDRFSVLTERLRQLDVELRERIREKALLREALDENRTLMRELQHRVKNNIQMMISLLSMSAANSHSPEIREFSADAKARLRALATTQDLIYEAQASTVIPAGELLGRLARNLAETTGCAINVRIEAADVWLPQESAHCLALILNELLTNSVKHGLSGTGMIDVLLQRRNGQLLQLVVQDTGRGYPDPEALPRSSGLTLIRGLCRQIGAGLELGNRDGARTVVTFADPGASGAPTSGTVDQAEMNPAST